MATLPTGTLSFFPIKYPLYTGAVGIVPEHSDPELIPTNRSCRRTDIRFRNDFSAYRNQGTHHSIDIFAGMGLEVVATTGGTVVHEWYLSGLDPERRSGAGQSSEGGNFVMIKDLEGFYHYYAHLLSPSGLREGQRITAGQIIGRVGNTGRASTTCPHLHYQVTKRELSENRRGILRCTVRYYNPYRELIRLRPQYRLMYNPNRRRRRVR